MPDAHRLFVLQVLLTVTACWCLYSSQLHGSTTSGVPTCDAHPRFVEAWITRASTIVIVPPRRLSAICKQPPPCWIEEPFAATPTAGMDISCLRADVFLYADVPFSGHGSSARGTMPDAHRFFVLQVRNCLTIFAKRSDDRFLLLLPCPQVLCVTLCECIDVALLLLRSGDVETNPGPNKNGAVRTDSVAQDEAQPDRYATVLKSLKKLTKGPQKWLKHKLR